MRVTPGGAGTGASADAISVASADAKVNSLYVPGFGLIVSIGWSFNGVYHSFAMDSTGLRSAARRLCRVTVTMVIRPMMNSAAMNIHTGTGLW